MIKAELPNGFQDTIFCPYCRGELRYLWNEGHLMGIGLDKWLFCNPCNKIFIQGIYGIRQTELDEDIEVVNE